MKITGEFTVEAPRAAVFDKLRDAPSFASYLDGVSELSQIDADRYEAVLETKVGFMKFCFDVNVRMLRVEAPDIVEARIEGVPKGIVGRLTATSVTRLVEDGDATRVRYEMDTALTGRLGSLGQPVVRAKAKEMEKQFVTRLRAAFAPTPGESR
jgi:carbon monoxide dehydrogenase subunit G